VTNSIDTPPQRACAENSSRPVFVCLRNPTGFVEQILPSSARGVKAPSQRVGKHLFPGHPGIHDGRPPNMSSRKQVLIMRRPPRHGEQGSHRCHGTPRRRAAGTPSRRQASPGCWSLTWRAAGLWHQRDREVRRARGLCRGGGLLALGQFLHPFRQIQIEHVHGDPPTVAVIRPAL
jgi:hypothetical protein